MLLRKMLRDMKANRTQFISIFLMSLLGVFVYAGINAEWYGMQTEIDRYYEETNFPDFWVMGEKLDKGGKAEAESVTGVAAAQLRLTLDATADLDGSPTVRVSIVDENRLSKPYRVEGAEFDPSGDGLWLDEAFARAHGLKTGDPITIRAAGMELKETIKGLALHPEYVYSVKDDSVFTPDPEAFGFAYLPRSAVPHGAALPYSELLVRLDGTADAAEVKSRLEDRLTGFSIILTRDTMLSPAQFKNEISQNRAMGGVFPVVFFLIAALAMLTTMTRITTGQRMQIGTLKALGYKRRKILFHYISYGLWLGLAGGVVGLFTGPAVIPPILFTMQRSIYNLPEWRGALSFTDVFAVVLAVLCCGLSSYLACRRELGDVPAETLRPRVPKTVRHTGFEKSALWHRLGFSAQWNLRDIARSRVRSAMAVVGVMGCTALLLLGLGLRDSVNGVTEWLYKDLYTFETRINLKEDITEAQRKALEEKYPGQWIQEAGVEIRAESSGKGKEKNREKNGLLTVAGPGSGYRFEDGGRKRIDLPADGIAISYKMAGLLGVQVGDAVQWRIYGRDSWQESEIGAIYRTPIGQGIALSQAAYEETGSTLQPTALLCKGSATGAEKLPGVESVQAKETLMNSFHAILDSMNMIIAILILAAVVLGVVVLYNLGTLSFTERTRELATLKVLGFPKKKIRSLLQKQNGWLTAIGIVIGIPAGYLFIIFMLSTISESSDFVADVSPLTLGISIVSTFLLSSLVSLRMSRRVEAIDMVGALKSVE
jgi:putative ABC transport system permease protein